MTPAEILPYFQHLNKEDELHGTSANVQENKAWRLLHLTVSYLLRYCLKELPLDKNACDCFLQFELVMEFALRHDRCSMWDNAFLVIFDALAPMREATKDDDELCQMLHIFESAIDGEDINLLEFPPRWFRRGMEHTMTLPGSCSWTDEMNRCLAPDGDYSQRKHECFLDALSPLCSDNGLVLRQMVLAKREIFE